ncbi:hypothetical protein ACIQV2_33010 [Streptomyces globosus]|uniref:hypothetical protein n=1 Tax=Streptomyces globosus TaxID=68209 RepID=UPI003804B39D
MLALLRTTTLRALRAERDQARAERDQARAEAASAADFARRAEGTAEAEGAARDGWTADEPGAALPPAAELIWRVQPLHLGGTP